MQLGSRYQLPVMMLRWALLTAAGGLMDRQLIGNALAGWPSYLWSLLLIVGTTCMAAAWQELSMRTRFSACWAKQQGGSTEAVKATESALQQGQDAAPAAVMYQASNRSSRGSRRASFSAGAEVEAASAGCADDHDGSEMIVAVAAAKHGQQSASSLQDVSHHGSVAAAAVLRLRKPSSTASQSLRDLLDSTVRSMQSQRKLQPPACSLSPCPEVLYRSKAAGQRVTISVKVSNSRAMDPMAA